MAFSYSIAGAERKYLELDGNGYCELLPNESWQLYNKTHKRGKRDQNTSVFPLGPNKHGAPDRYPFGQRGTPG